MYYEQHPQQPPPSLPPHSQPSQQLQLPGMRQTYEQIKQIQQQQQMLQQQFHTQQQLQSSPIYSTLNSSPIKQFNPDTVNNLQILSPLKTNYQVHQLNNKIPKLLLNGALLFHQIPKHHYLNNSKNHHYKRRHVEELKRLHYCHLENLIIIGLDPMKIKFIHVLIKTVLKIYKKI